MLGEAEADRRLAEIGRLVSRPDVDYVSVKVSAVASQLHPWDTGGSTERVVAKLLPAVPRRRRARRRSSTSTWRSTTTSR